MKVGDTHKEWVGEGCSQYSASMAAAAATAARVSPTLNHITLTLNQAKLQACLQVSESQSPGSTVSRAAKGASRPGAAHVSTRPERQGLKSIESQEPLSPLLVLRSGVCCSSHPVSHCTVLYSARSCCRTAQGRLMQTSSIVSTYCTSWGCPHREILNLCQPCRADVARSKAVREQWSYMQARRAGLL